MKLHRLGALVGASALVMLGTYACSSDDNTTNTNDAGTNADTGSGSSTSSTSSSGGNELPDTGSQETPDTGADSGDLSGCVGNPIAVADAGTPDASFQSDAATTIGTASFPYGPLWTDELGGQLVYSGTDLHGIFRTDGKGGGTTLISTTDDTNTHLPLQNAYSNGFIYTAISTDPGPGGSIMKTQADASADASTYMALPMVGANTIAANGIAIHAKGIIYFTDPEFQNAGVATPGVYSMPVAGGAVTTVSTFDPNVADDRPVGIAFNRDQSALFVSHVVYDGTNYSGYIAKYAVDANGVASNPVRLSFVPAGGPAGIAIDSGGNIWIAEQARDGSAAGLVEVIDATGATRWATLSVPNAHVNGVALGGADRKTVYLTTDTTTGGGEDAIYSLPTRCQGF